MIMNGKIMVSVRSCKGKVRAENEDNFFAGGMFLPPDLDGRDFSLDGVLPNTVVLAVCDGVGGEAMGKEASEIAVKRLSDMQEHLMNSRSDNLSSAVHAYISNADSGISSLKSRAGTTLALAVIQKGVIRCFNVGDSRIYCFRKGKLSRITNDHNTSALTLKTAELVGDNKLTRCIGIGCNNHAESYPPIKGKCKLLLCSDGLSGMLSDEEIEKTLSSFDNIGEAADSLMEKALKAGGTDNVTIVLADLGHKKRMVKK